jgi:uncharacterized SAM-dependent methyltransferase
LTTKNLPYKKRINRELGGDFDTDKFVHRPEYTESEGIARSYLISTEDQNVNIGKIGKTYWFKKGEKILTEISRKYNDEIIGNIIRHTDFKLIQKLTDSKKYFANYILHRE